MIDKMFERSWKSKRELLGLLLASLLSFFSMGFPWNTFAADRHPDMVIDCDIQHGPCTKHLVGRDVTLDILPKPVRAMKDLTFRLTVGGKKLSANPTMDLSMPGMNMGPNRVELRPEKDHLYEGHGIIVRCPSGRRTWKATVTLPDSGIVEFVFDVIY